MNRGDIRLGVVVFAVLIVLAFIGLLAVCDEDDGRLRDDIGAPAVYGHGDRDRGRDSRGDCENSDQCSDDDFSPDLEDSPVIICLPESSCQF